MTSPCMNSTVQTTRDNSAIRRTNQQNMFGKYSEVNSNQLATTELSDVNKNSASA